MSSIWKQGGRMSDEKCCIEGYGNGNNIIYNTYGGFSAKKKKR